jgi:hypothetical protein
VWASKFTYQDFEDEVFGAAEPSPDELPERRHDTPEAPPPSAFSASANADNDSDEPFTGVRLNIGRKHGKKAADIRGLLASRLDLAGRAIRNLTVGDASTRLNVSETNAHLMISQLTGYGVDDISLEVSMVDSTPELESNGKDDLEHGAASVAEASEPKPTESVSAEVPPRAPDASDTAAPS